MNAFTLRKLTFDRNTDFISSKRISEHTRLTMFANSPNINSSSSVQRYRRFTPLWNINDSEIKPIKSRSRLDDFPPSSLNHIFPQKSPVFGQSSKLQLPPITPEQKYFNKKSDQIVTHREALIRLKKQGFLILRQK